MFSRGAKAAEKSAPAKRGAPGPAMLLEAFLPQPAPLSSFNHGRLPASRCAVNWTDLADVCYRHDRSVSLPFIFLFSQAGRLQQAIPATHMTVVPPWNNFWEAGPPLLACASLLMYLAFRSDRRRHHHSRCLLADD